MTDDDFVVVVNAPDVTTAKVTKQKEEGYLDDILDVLEECDHPCIILGRYALRWMGVGVWCQGPLDLLIRNSQVNLFVTCLVRTGRWEAYALVPAFKEDYLQPPPRIFRRSDGTFSIKIWSEKATHMLVDIWPLDAGNSSAAGAKPPFLIEAPDCEALNSVLLESSMHPDPASKTSRPYLLTTPDVRFLPRVRCQSIPRRPQTKIYIPSVWRYLDALLAQARWLDANGYASFIAYGPNSDVRYLVRYLFLELPDQRRKVLPFLDPKSRLQLERILDEYKRTDKAKGRVKTGARQPFTEPK